MAVVVISTGGTIASTEDSGGDASPELGGEELVAAVPELEEVADIRTRDFSNVPSPHFTVSQMYSLVEEIREFDADPRTDGIVVTQGTDILEESSYFVDLCYDGTTPVVFTGAMRNPSLPSPDGPINLLNSVRTTQDEAAGEAGVLVVLNDRVHPAREVTKMHTTNVDTFRSPEFGPLAVVDEGQLTWRRTSADPDPPFDPDPGSLTNEVFALFVTADMPPSQVPDPGECSGLCLAATGAGHIPETLIEPLATLRDASVPLVATSRCPEGRLARQTYAFPGSEQTLHDELGFRFSALNLQKTRIKTVVAMAADGLDIAFT